MSSRPRRILLYVALGLVVWYGVVLGVWAFRPLEDTVPGSLPAPTVLDPDAVVPATVEVSCGTLFDPDDVSLEAVSPGFIGDRDACDLVVSDARRVLVLDTAMVVLGLVAVVLVGRRLARSADDLPDVVAAT